MINDGIIGIAVYHDGYDDDNTFNVMVIYIIEMVKDDGH